MGENTEGKNDEVPVVTRESSESIRWSILLCIGAMREYVFSFNFDSAKWINEIFAKFSYKQHIM